MSPIPVWFGLVRLHHNSLHLETGDLFTEPFHCVNTSMITVNQCIAPLVEVPKQHQLCHLNSRAHFRQKLLNSDQLGMYMVPDWRPDKWSDSIGQWLRYFNNLSDISTIFRSEQGIVKTLQDLKRTLVNILDAQCQRKLLSIHLERRIELHIIFLEIP